MWSPTWLFMIKIRAAKLVCVREYDSKHIL